jgi:hypothetical protein
MFRFQHSFIATALLLCAVHQARSADCPTPIPPTQRDTNSSSAYYLVHDRQVSDVDMPAVQDSARESSLASGSKQTLWIAFESIDNPANGIYLTRWTMNGFRHCLCLPASSSNCDEPYIRLDDPGAEITGQHRHVSIATRRADKLSSQQCFSCQYALFGCWQATASGSGNQPELLQFAQPFLIPGAASFKQATFDGSPGRVAIAGVNNNDVAPSAGLAARLQPTHCFGKRRSQTIFARQVSDA